MKPTFVVQRTSNHGTSNPIVARLECQTLELIRWLKVTDDEVLKILNNYRDLRHRLLNCFDIHRRLISARDSALSETKKVLKKGQNTVPHVIGLQDEIENFLFAAKTYLREVARLLNNLFQANLKIDSAIFWNPKGKKSMVAIWAKDKFGVDHDITRMLTSDAEWIGEIIRKRNAVEHPGGVSGTLKLSNFEVVRDGIIPPLWAREGSGDAIPTDIYKDIPIMIDNMLTLAEDLLVQAIQADLPFERLILAYVPEQERNPENPVRIKATANLGVFSQNPT